VCIRDLATGQRSNRPHDTLTLDVPVDFPRAGVFSVADGFRATYLAVGGKQVICNVTPRPLSWRTQGETCLVARSAGSARRLRQYRLCFVEHTADAPPPGALAPPIEN
jgi:hypothetical protein